MTANNGTEQEGPPPIESLLLPPAGAAPPPAERGGGPEAGGVPGQLQTETAKSIYAIFHGLDIAHGRKNLLEEGYGRIMALSERVAEDATSGGRTRKAVASDLRGEIETVYRIALTQQRDIPPAAQTALTTPEGRVLFRIRAFNKLCEEKKFGLEQKDSIVETMTDSEFDKYGKNRLRDFWNEFDAFCSEYDMGNTKRVLDKITDEVAAKEMPASRLDRIQFRGDERARLMEKIAGRVHKEMGESYVAVDQSREISRYLVENGGDLAIKGAAIGLLAVNPLLAAGVWSTRGIIESMGGDFGSLLRKIGRIPQQIAQQGARGLYGFVSKFLPYRWKEKIPKKTQKWLSERTPPDFEKVSTGSLTWAERKALFFKGFAPLPEISVPALRWLRPRAKHLGALALWKGKEKWAKRKTKGNEPARKLPKRPEFKKAEVPDDKKIEKAQSTDIITKERKAVRDDIFRALKFSLDSFHPPQEGKKAS